MLAALKMGYRGIDTSEMNRRIPRLSQSDAAWLWGAEMSFLFQKCPDRNLTDVRWACVRLRQPVHARS